MADLSGLSLWRNDPALAAKLVEQASQGDMDAQYAAGLIYAEGRGVAVDLVQAYYWLTLAAEQGDADAVQLRQHIGAGMSDAEFDAARHLLKAARATSPGGSAQHDKVH